MYTRAFSVVTISHRMRFKRTSIAICAALMASTGAAQAFVIKAIQFQGLNHIPRDTVMRNIPIKVGQDLTSKESNQLLNDLYQTGFFSDASLYNNHGTLVINVTERPTIADVEFSGNQLIKKDDLQKVLNKVGLTVGNTFNETTLNQLRQSLEQEYIALGKYAVRVKIDVKKLPRNRVDIDIKISEGLSATVQHINIVGNHAFDSSTLTDQLAVSAPGWFSFITGGDKYNRGKLNKSMKALDDFYMNRGYIHFHVASVQASVDPTRRDVFVTINVHEGKQYQFSNYTLAGHLVLPEATVRQLITVQSHSVFSRAEVLNSAKAISSALKNEGYAFAQVNPVPHIDEKTHTVSVTFYVSPGKKVTVKQINIAGNTVTNDQTLRERIKYVEGSVYSGKNMHNTKIALERLPYVKHLGVSTTPVPGSSDELDVNYKVLEQSSNSVSANIGYSQLNRFIVGGSLNMPNVFGTGNIFNINAALSKPYQSLSFGYTEPFFTLGGISQSFNLYMTRVDNAQRDLTNYSTNSFGGTLNYAIPMSTWTFFNIGGGYDHTKLLQPKDDVSATVANFTQDNGTVFNTFTINFGVSRNTTNSSYFPTAGSDLSLNSTIAVPGSKLDWYKLTASGVYYIPIAHHYTLSFDAGAGLGGGYGNNDHLPFYNNFYGGDWGSGNGFGRLRGFTAGSLGPDDKLCDNSTGQCSDSQATAGNSIGGNLMVDASANLYFPIPFVADQDSFRMGVFADAGNVYLTYDTDTVYTGDRTYPHSPTLNNLRYSTGLSFQWKSPFGPLAFSLAYPLNRKPGDNVQVFQFSLGHTF